MNKRKAKLKELIIIWGVLFTIVGAVEGEAEVPYPEFTEVWGPGLEPHKIVMPARYFFIRAVDKNNKSILHSIQDEFQIIIEGGTKQNKPCRIWSNILDRKDGSLIVRYKVYEECSNITINIKYKDYQHAAKSPYLINEAIHPDDCFCPRKAISDLLDSWECNSVPPQIVASFEPFKNIDWNVERHKVIKQFDKPHAVSLCHYVIKDNKVYRKCYGKYVGFNMFSDSILLSLARKAILPDLEFFVNLGDWPLSTKDLPEKYPIFSWCGSTDSHDIVMPTYEVTEAALENMGRVMLDMLSVQGNVKYPWEKREPKLFWRGRDSNKYRLDLITLSRKHPKLFNASLTNFFFYRDQEDVYGPKTEYVSFFQFFDYKYQLAIDGTVAGYRTPFLLGGGSLIFKPHSKYYEHFYSKLKPNIHYVPVQTDLSDLMEKIVWAKNYDSEAKTIAQNGQRFANDNLLPQHIFCYHLHLLNELSKVLSSEVRVLDGMELVDQKKSIPCDCLEVKEKSKKDEL